MSGASTLATKRRGVYVDLRGQAAEPGGLDAICAEQIERDLRRTFPKHALWMDDGTSRASAVVGSSDESQGVRV